MEHSVSIVMLALMLVICVTFNIKGWRKQASSQEDQKWVLSCLGGAAIGFIAGILLGAISPEIFFSEGFLRKEAGELGAIALLSIGFSVIGAFVSLVISGLIKRLRPN